MVFIWKQARWTPHSSSHLLLLTRYFAPPLPLLPNTSFQRRETGLEVWTVWCSGAIFFSIGLLQRCCTGKLIWTQGFIISFVSWLLKSNQILQLFSDVMAAHYTPFIDGTWTWWRFSMTKTSVSPQKKFLSYYWPELHCGTLILTKWLHFNLNILGS